MATPASFFTNSFVLVAPLVLMSEYDSKEAATKHATCSWQRTICAVVNSPAEINPYRRGKSGILLSTARRQGITISRLGVVA